jgi:hypothetical protein
MEMVLEEHRATNLSLFTVLFKDYVCTSNCIISKDCPILNYRMRKEVCKDLF